MDGKYAGVNFLFLILITSGGFRLVLTKTLSLPYNVTQFVGTNVVFECRSDCTGSSSYPPSWIKDRRRTVIYKAQDQMISDPTKYSVGNGSNTLTVMNVQLSDATMYCCVVGLNDCCSNLVVIESLTASVNPSNGAEVGENFNLICSLTYNAPPMDVDYPFPLSDDQDPQLLMFIGTTEITKETTGEQIVGIGTVPHSKTLISNRTVAKEDIGKNLTCMVSSTNPPLRNQTTVFIPVRVATRHAEIRYPNGSRNRDDVYPVNSVFLCVGDGFPIPSVEWLDGNKSLGNRSKGSVLWTAAEPGTYDLICSAWNELSQNTTYNATRVKVVNSGGNSGGFRQALNHTKSLRNVTQSVDTNVVIECRSESMNSTDQTSWFKYDNGTIVIYNASSSSNINSSKYSVGTGNKTLTVMNVQLSDAATYCCNVGGLDDYYCSNVVIIGFHTPSVKPSNRVEIGDNVTLRCTFNFNAPKSYLGDPFPLSDDQAPKLSMLFGKSEISVQDNYVKLFMVYEQEEMFQKQDVDVATVPREKTIITINKTLVLADLDRNLECRVSSTQPWWYTDTFIQIVSLDIDIIYPKRDWSYDAYKVNDVFQCVAQRFPFLNITWTDETKPGTPRLISTGLGNATAKIFAAGTYRWRCTIYSPLKQSTSYSEFGFKALSDSEGNKGSAGLRNTLPILLTACCMLFTTVSIT